MLVPFVLKNEGCLSVVCFGLWFVIRNGMCLSVGMCLCVVCVLCVLCVLCVGFVFVWGLYVFCMCFVFVNGVCSYVVCGCAVSVCVYLYVVVRFLFACICMWLFAVADMGQLGRVVKAMDLKSIGVTRVSSNLTAVVFFSFSAYAVRHIHLPPRHYTTTTTMTSHDTLNPAIHHTFSNQQHMCLFLATGLPDPPPHTHARATLFALSTANSSLGRHTLPCCDQFLLPVCCTHS